MFSIFKKSTNLTTDINWLGVDIHSHLLPGIDDGAKTVEESISYVSALKDLGFDKLICTPHIFAEVYPNTPETILPVLHTLKQALVAARIDIDINASAEYMVDDSFSVGGALLPLSKNYLLIEMSYLNESPNIEQVIFDLQIRGYQVVLAHPERYNFYHKNHARYSRLRDMGCLFQLNLLSVLGYYGKNVQDAADYLLIKKHYDLAATDLHHNKHLQELQKAVHNGQLHKLIGNYEFKNKSLFSYDI